MGGPQVNILQIMAAGQADCVMGSSDLQMIQTRETGVPVVNVAAFSQKDPQVIISHPGVGNDSLAALKVSLESEWVRRMQELVGVSELPLLWDADFLYGPRDASGADSYVLCEINVSCVTPFPAEAPPAIANAVRDRLLAPDEAG